MSEWIGAIPPNRGQVERFDWLNFRSAWLIVTVGLLCAGRGGPIVKSKIRGAGKGALVTLSAETGQSLVLALVVVLAVSVSAAGLVAYTTSNDTSFNRDRDATRATAIAEAGVQNAMSIISQYDAATSTCVYSASTCPSGRLPVSGTTSYNADGGTGSWYATKTQVSTGPNVYAIWRITATATSPDGRVLRTVEANTHALPPLTVVLPIFNYALYVGGSGAAPVPARSATVTRRPTRPSPAASSQAGTCGSATTCARLATRRSPRPLTMLTTFM